jgi:hydroxymethylpyrimidine/phosphomethylpyrimidine kinase
MEFMERPIVMTIAGFDPSGGAGILADIKTFEQINVYGICVITAITLQTEKEFQSVRHRSISNLIEEIEFLTKHYSVRFAKIGMIKDAETLQEVVSILHRKKIKIIWDPILKTSTHKQTFVKHSIPQLKSILNDIYCITPNVNESLEISGKSDITEAGLDLSQHTNVIIKGGHNPSEKGTDLLFIKNTNQSIKIPPQTQLEIEPKHGSGCVFSAALTAYLSLGFSLEESAIKAKIYTEHFLASNNSLLGYHSK